VLPGARVKVGFGGSREKYVLCGPAKTATRSRARRLVEPIWHDPGIGAVTRPRAWCAELIVRPDSAARRPRCHVAGDPDTLRIATPATTTSRSRS